MDPCYPDTIVNKDDKPLSAKNISNTKWAPYIIMN